MRRIVWISVAVCISLFIWLGKGAAADEKTEEARPKASRFSKAEKLMDESLERYKVYEGSDTEPLKPQHVLTWNNPIAGGLGRFRTVVFLKDGQPKSVCCIWGGAKNLYHEFGSLSRNSLRGELDGRPAWSMPESGDRFKAIPNADQPVGDRRRRLLQMKRLAQRFTAIENQNRKGERDEVPLRMLPTPLYRYEKESEELIDGAIFCFAHTTDPEALVVIEAVPSDVKPRWEYAFIRRSSLPVTGYLDAEEVWSTDEAGYRTFNQRRYHSENISN